MTTKNRPLWERTTRKTTYGDQDWQFERAPNANCLICLCSFFLMIVQTAALVCYMKAVNESLPIFIFHNYPRPCAISVHCAKLAPVCPPADISRQVMSMYERTKEQSTAMAAKMLLKMFNLWQPQERLDSILPLCATITTKRKHWMLNSVNSYIFSFGMRRVRKVQSPI